MTTVVAQGTFDLLHPGHVHYLEEAASMGDELHVVLARRSNVDHKPDPILSASQRRAMVAALDPVDGATLGHPEDVFVPIDRIEPDVLALGHDQFHDEAELERVLRERGHDCEVVRASECEFDDPDAVLSSSRIVERILDRRHERLPARMRPPEVRNQYP
jgi:FAD synthetase